MDHRLLDDLPAVALPEHEVELVRTALRRFEAGELDDSLFHDDARMTGPDGWPEQGPFEGRDAIRAQFERLAADSAAQRFEDLETVAATEEWVVVRFCWVVRGAASGIETRFPMSAAYQIADDRFAEAHFRWTDAEALAAAGLEQ